MIRFVYLSLFFVVNFGLCPAAIAQESALTLAATQPAKSRFTLREQARFERFDLEQETIEQWTLDTRIVYGLRKDISLTMNIPSIVRDRSGPSTQEQDQSGIGDVSLSLKWRFWQHDPGPVDTNRLALYARLSAPTGNNGLSSEGWDPSLGIIFTRVSGRHGINASLVYQFSTDGITNPITAGSGDADLLSIENSYLFRIAPAEYSAETEASLYLSIESLVEYETNGDIEWRLAPGLLYEARRWTAEFSPIVPIANDVHNRAELDWGLALGFRILF